MNVAFPYIDRRLWQGGYNYLLNLLGALDLLEDKPIQPVIFASDDVPESDLEAFDAISCSKVVRSPHFRRDRFLRRQSEALIIGRDNFAEGLYRSHDIAGVFESAFFHGMRSTLPAIVWIADFQHRNLPKFFSAKRYWKRDLGIRFQLAFRQNILLSSGDAASDLRKYYPRFDQEIHILRFCAALPLAIKDVDFEDLRRRYNLPRSFIFLPNQFYHHKNHTVVVDALEILRQNGDALTVIATGSTSGSPETNSFQSVEQRIRQAKLDSDFRILGSIPYLDVLGLMLMSSAMLNPSLFEGWSSTVEEAKALEVPLILSDIDVHREQAEGTALFFDPKNATDLADKMATAISREGPSEIDIELEQLIRRNQQARLRLGQLFASILRDSFATD